MANWCEAAEAVCDVVSRKWVVPVLGALADGPRRHNDLHRAVGRGIHPTVLDGTLRHLESTGLVRRELAAANPPPTWYQLADLGVSMAASLAAPREPVVFAYYRFRHFERLVAAVYAQRKRLPGMSMAALHGSPDCTDVLRFWMGQGVKRMAVQPMLLFAGRSLQGVADAAGAWPVTMGRTLSEHAEMPVLVADCLRGAA